jgi:hypothetical protein
MRILLMALRVTQLVMQLANLDVSAPPSSGSGSGPASGSGPHSRAASLEDDEDDGELSPVRTGPPSEASSHEWDKLAGSANLAA